MLLHRDPHIQKERVVGAGADGRSAEFIVPSILQSNSSVEPRPSRRLAANERDVRDLRDPALRPWISQNWVESAPAREILAGKDDPLLPYASEA
jgi:hypothetical protein